MFLSARRPVFVPDSAYLVDEGRMSEYDEAYNIPDITGQADLRMNRIPQVFVYDAATKSEVEVSFHQIHKMPSSAVYSVTIVPYIYTHRGYTNWDFRLVSLRVVGKRLASLMESPRKLVTKRKLVVLDLSDDEEEPKGKHAKK
nr:predicted protein [Mycena chlorophos]